MHGQRVLDWEGAFNARDLGGLRAAGGRTRWGAVVRFEHPATLTAAGWRQLREHGVRTIIDLTGHEEADLAPRPRELHGVRQVLDAPRETEFWQRWGGAPSCTPLYYAAFLDRFPDKIAGVLAAIADAHPGGVLVHCGGGRDRNGLIVLVLLAAMGVGVEDIAADYALSHQRRREQCAARGLDDDTPKIRQYLFQRDTSEHSLITEVVTGRDFAAYLRGTGLGEAGLAALRARVLDAG